MARRGGLGKGLGALIPPADRGRRRPETGRPRRAPGRRRSGRTRTSRGSTSTRRRSASLAESIREVGVLQPVLVRPVGDGEYELIAGERRWRAARRVGLQTIPALVRETDDAAALEQALVENLHRDDLNPLEEAAAYQQLIEDFGLTHDEVATRVGRSRATVTNTLRLLQLPPSIQSRSSERHALDGPRPGAARHAGPRVPGAARQAGRRRGPLGARGRGGGPRARAASPTPRPATEHRSEPARRRGGAPAAGSARARGAARRPPRHAGHDLDGQRRAARSWSSSRPSRTSSGSTGVIDRAAAAAEHAATRRLSTRGRELSRGRRGSVGGCSTPRRTPADDGVGDVGAAQRRASRMRVDVVVADRFADDRGHPRLAQDRVGAAARRTARRRAPARARAAHRVGDREAGLGAEPARLEVAAAAARARRRRGPRGRGRRRSGWPPPRASESSAPEASSTASAPSLEEPADHAVAERLEPGGGGDEDPVAREAVRTAAQRLALADAGDRAVGEAVPSAGRARRWSPARRCRRRSRPDVALELAQRAGGVGAEDAVLAAGVEAERVEPVLELGDVVAAQHRAAAVEQPVAEAEAALDQRRPGLGAADAVDPQAARRPGTRATAALGGRRRTRPARPAGSS